MTDGTRASAGLHVRRLTGLSPELTRIGVAVVDDDLMHPPVDLVQAPQQRPERAVAPELLDVDDRAEATEPLGQRPRRP
jgi:hypothetical protein